MLPTLLAASRTLRTAIERIVRYNAVVDPVVFFEDTLDETRLRLTYRTDGLDLPDILALQDARWAVVLGLCREAYGPGCGPLEVTLTHAAPPCQGEYFALFRCPVRFDAPVTELVFDRAMVERPLPAANRELALANDGILRGYVDQLASDDIVARAPPIRTCWTPCAGIWPRSTSPTRAGPWARSATCLVSPGSPAFPAPSGAGPDTRRARPVR